MNGANHRMQITLCELKFDDPDHTFDDWECDQKGVRCEYCIIKERYESRNKHRKRS